MLFLLALGCWPWRLHAQPAATIELRTEVRAAGPALVLGDLARLQSADLALLRRLVDLPVGRSPAAGVVAVVDRDTVAGWLHRRTGLAPDQVTWQGAGSIRVLSALRTVAGDDVAAVASAAFDRWIAARGLRGQGTLSAAPRDFDAPQGALRLQARSLEGAVPRNRVTVWVDVWVADRFHRSLPVTFTVDLSGEGIVSAAPPAGGSEPPQERQAMPAVQRGTWASLRSGDGAVHIESRVQVLQDGRIGDRVRVRAGDSAPGLLVRVAGPGQLEVAR